MSIDSSDLSSSLSDSSSSSIDEEVLMDQIEFDLHRERVARAWKIVHH
jgi:hypothetical protein